ncbi:hypothetical protein DV735_g4152, partial [Chaetothyriales sp. CBS 134920]
MAETSAPKPSSSVKLVLLGEAAVGKSSLVLRFVNNDFQENKEPTIGAAFLTQKISLPSRIIKFEIWDTAGQERFASLAPMYYRNAQAALVVYDLTKPTSLTKAKHWVAELQRQASPGIVIALVGNKLDLCSSANSLSELDTEDAPDAEGEAERSDEGDARKIPTREAKAYAEEESLLFFETSAKTGTNVADVFTAIANAIPETSLKSSRAATSGGTQAALSGASNRANDASINLADRAKQQKDNSIMPSHLQERVKTVAAGEVEKIRAQTVEAVYSRAYLYPIKGVYYFLSHRDLWKPLKAKLIPTITAGTGVTIACFALLYLPQAAVLAFTSGPTAAFSAALLTLSQSSTITNLIAKTFLTEEALTDEFDGTLLSKGYTSLVEDGRHIKAGSDNIARLGKLIKKPFAKLAPSAIIRYVLYWPLNFIPIVGTLIFIITQGRRNGPAALSRYFQLKGWSKTQRDTHIEANRGAYTAFGVVSYLFEMIPFAGLAFAFTNAVGAALWAADLEKNATTAPKLKEKVNKADPNAMAPPILITLTLFIVTLILSLPGGSVAGLHHAKLLGLAARHKHLAARAAARAHQVTVPSNPLSFVTLTLSQEIICGAFEANLTDDDIKKYSVICNVDFPGQNILPFLKVASFDQCKEKCDEYTDSSAGLVCAGFVFAPDRVNGGADDCYLKFSLNNPVSATINLVGATARPSSTSPSYDTWTAATAASSPTVADVKLLGASVDTPTNQYVSHSLVVPEKLDESLLKPGINADLITDFPLAGDTGVYTSSIMASRKMVLQTMKTTPKLSRDGGKGGMLNGTHIVFFCDTGVTSDGQLVSLVSSSVTTDITMNGLQDKALELVDNLGEWQDDVGRMRGFAPMTVGEESFNTAMAGLGYRYAIWPESSPIPINLTHSLIYGSIVYADVDMSSQEYQLSPVGNTVLVITNDQIWGPHASRPVVQLFQQEEITYGSLGGFRAWGVDGPGSEDGEIYLFGRAPDGVFVAKTIPSAYTLRDSYSFWDGNQWAATIPDNSNQDALILNEAVMDFDLIYAPYYQTLIMIYITNMADNTFYYRFCQQGDIIPPYQEHGQSDWGEAMMSCNWTASEVLYVTPKPPREFSYAGGVHAGYYGDDDITNGGQKMLISWTSKTGESADSPDAGYAHNTASVNWGRGHVSAGHGRVGKHRKHPGGRGMAGGQHHHRTNIDKYHPGYFGKVGMRYFHKTQNKFWKPTVNLDKLWSLIPAETREAYLSKKKTDTAPVLDLLPLGYSKVLGKGRIPEIPIVVRARYFSKEAEKKIKEAGGVVELVA